MKKIMLGTSDAWWTIHLTQQTSESEPAYYFVDCRILKLPTKNIAQLNAKFGNVCLTCLIPAKGLQRPQSHYQVTNRHLNVQTCLDLIKHDQIDRTNTGM